MAFIAKIHYIRETKIGLLKYNIAVIYQNILSPIIRPFDSSRDFNRHQNSLFNTLRPNFVQNHSSVSINIELKKKIKLIIW